MFSSKAQRKKAKNVFDIQFFSLSYAQRNTKTKHYRCTSSLIHKTFFIVASLLFSIRKTIIDKYHVKAFTRICTELRLAKFSFGEKFLLLLCTRTNILRINDANERCGKTNSKVTSSIVGYDVIANFIGFILYLRL